MNPNIENLVAITSELADEGKEPKLIILPSAIKRPRKMMLRGRKTSA